MKSGKILLDKIADSVLKELTNVENAYLREHRRRWFGNLERMNAKTLTRRVQEKITLVIAERGRPKTTW